MLPNVGRVTRAIVLALLLTAIPLALADTCVPTCGVQSVGNRIATRAFVPAISVVQSGSSLTWTDSAADGEGHMAAAKDGSYCFISAFSPSAGGSALFAISGGVLYASSAIAGDLQPCDVAPAPDGSFLLDYYCVLHPEMTGKILVHG